MFSLVPFRVCGHCVFGFSLGVQDVFDLVFLPCVLDMFSVLWGKTNSGLNLSQPYHASVFPLTKLNICAGWNPRPPVDFPLAFGGCGPTRKTRVPILVFGNQLVCAIGLKHLGASYIFLWGPVVFS